MRFFVFFCTFTVATATTGTLTLGKGPLNGPSLTLPAYGKGSVGPFTGTIGNFLNEAAFTTLSNLGKTLLSPQQWSQVNTEPNYTASQCSQILGLLLANNSRYFTTQNTFDTSGNAQAEQFIQEAMKLQATTTSWNLEGSLTITNNQDFSVSPRVFIPLTLIAVGSKKLRMIDETLIASSSTGDINLPVSKVQISVSPTAKPPTTNFTLPILDLRDQDDKYYYD